MKPVYILPNGKALGPGDFYRYLEKKVLYTIRKFEMNREAKVKKNTSVNSRVLNYLYNKFGFLKNDSKIIALDDSTDDIATAMMESWFANKNVDLSPKSPRIIRPLFLITEQEMMIYASLKHLKGNTKKKTSARTMLDNMEKVHPEIKRAIVQAYLQLVEIRKKK
ncbi:MAG: hypothetical protein KKE23_00275 [Nanoarchaeota archaeon]|nr:hypothetical protein [Nanoarchaeota archaeon]